MAVLVATTVIEVGVDVPNASLMVVEHAERFGLSQLHQLRGRVGRGSVASVCVLLYTPPLSQTGKARLRAMAETNDGFEIARRDLEIRGPGEFMGARQSGDALLRFADLQDDAPLLRTRARSGAAPARPLARGRPAPRGALARGAGRVPQGLNDEPPRSSRRCPGRAGALAADAATARSRPPTGEPWRSHADGCCTDRASPWWSAVRAAWRRSPASRRQVRRPLAALRRPKAPAA